MDLDTAGNVFVSASAYADPTVFDEACRLLRRDDPIHPVRHPEFPEFHAITKHADVLEIELHNREFENAPRPVLNNLEVDRRRAEQGDLLRTLIHMDDPDHRKHRNLVADWFLPKNLAKLEGRLDELARQSVERMVELGGECDFARQIAMQYPLQVILAILGLPESDYPRMLQLTQELFGSDDPDLARSEDAIAGLIEVVQDFFAYFGALTEARRAVPTADLASVIANGTIDGEPLGLMETISYYVIAATAGHDTTAAALGGGMQALAEHPDQLARLRADPSLLGTAADEMIRWVTPVKHFMRNVTTPYELRGHRFEPGDAVLLSYASANRDEEVFDDPFTFDVGRSPNKHLSFGFGVHYCLGAMLARMELKSLFGALLPRLGHVELAGPPELIRTTFVGGLKRLPLRYSMLPG